MLYFPAMGVLLPSERNTRKGRFFLTFVYSLLALGGLTMVYPCLGQLDHRRA